MPMALIGPLADVLKVLVFRFIRPAGSPPWRAVAVEPGGKRWDPRECGE